MISHQPTFQKELMHRLIGKYRFTTISTYRNVNNVGSIANIEKGLSCRAFAGRFQCSDVFAE